MTFNDGSHGHLEHFKYTMAGSSSSETYLVAWLGKLVIFDWW